MAQTTQDHARAMQEMFGKFPFDAKVFEDAFRAQAELGEKMARLAIDAAGKSTEISARWTKETLEKLADMTKAKEDPAAYAEALSAFAAKSTEMAAENLAAFAEVAKKVQSETVELMISAGQEMSEEAREAVEKANEEIARVVRGASAAGPAAKGGKSGR